MVGFAPVGWRQTPEIVVLEQFPVGASVFIKLCLQEKNTCFIHLLEISVVAQIVLLQIVYFLFDICKITKVKPIAGNTIRDF